MDREYKVVGGPVNTVKLPVKPEVGYRLHFDAGAEQYKITNIVFDIKEDELNYGVPTLYIRRINIRAERL